MGTKFVVFTVLDKVPRLKLSPSGALSVIAVSVLLNQQVSAEAAKQNPLPEAVTQAYAAMALTASQKTSVNHEIAALLNKAQSAVKRETLRHDFPTQRRIKQKVKAVFDKGRPAVVQQLQPEQVPAYDLFCDTVVGILSSEGDIGDEGRGLRSIFFEDMAHDH